MTAAPTGRALPAPFRCGPFTVRPEWIDENEHLNLAYYVMLFDWATDAIWRPLGLGEKLRNSGRGTFAVEAHTLYRAELVVSETVTIESIVLGCDEKRLHMAHEMRRERDGVVSAQQELMYLGVDLRTRRVAPWPQETLAGLSEAVAAHQGMTPDWIGRRITMPMRA